MIIGLTGFRHSGKTEVGKILREQGFEIVSFGDEVRLERDARGLPYDCDLHKLRIDLRKEFGAQYWGKRVLGRMDLNSGGKYIADGMRTLGDLDVLRKVPDFNLVGITAPDEIRWERCKKRGRPDDSQDYGEFIRRDMRDRSSKEGGLQSEALFALRDYTIVNDSDLAALRLRTLGVLAQLEE